MPLYFEDQRIDGGGAGGGCVTLDQVNAAIDEKLAEHASMEVYSEEEIVIGTYFDQPLYKRTFVGQAGIGSNSGITLDPFFTDTKEMITAYGSLHVNMSNRIVTVPFPHTGVTEKGFLGDNVKIELATLTDNKSLMIAYTSPASFNFIIAVEYIKTTDTPTT